MPPSAQETPGALMDAIRRYAVRQAGESGLLPVEGILRGTAQGWLAPTPKNIATAKAFLLDKWRERAREQGQVEPTDLTDACKFASVFAQCVFGGRLRGNWHHQWVAHSTAGKIDLTDAAGVEYHSARCLRSGCFQGAIAHHDARFWANPDHAEDVESVLPRVARWVVEFKALKLHPDKN